MEPSEQQPVLPNTGAVENAASINAKSSYKLPISEEELARGAKFSKPKEIGNAKYLLIGGGAVVGFCIKLFLAVLNKALPGAYYIYFPFSIISFVFLLTMGKGYAKLYYLSIGLLIAMVL